MRDSSQYRRRSAAVAESLRGDLRRRPGGACAGLAHRCLALAVCALAAGLASAATEQASPPAAPEAQLLAALEAVCGSAQVHAEGQDMALPGGTLVEKSPLVVRGRDIGWRRRFAMSASGEVLLLETIEPGGLLRRVHAQLNAPVGDSRKQVLPVLTVIADGQCRVQAARRLVYDADGKAESLEQLSPTLDEVQSREPVNPPVPAASAADTRAPADGPAVGMVDAGVNYLLPAIAARLARDANGEIRGYDYWDLDARPFDSNPAQSVFFPQRHGTRTASLLLQEAPNARLVPYRYPRPDMTRMRDLVEDAAAAGVVIVNLSLGSNRMEEWQAFEQAAAAHPEMLFVVSAGNNGRDIDSQPVYPAGLKLDNMLVVSSADADGRPAPGSNWGRESVDLLVPAEEMLVTDFHGHVRVASGSSYAAARVSALAACLLEANPDWRAEILKAAILEQARSPDAQTSAYSTYGFLPDPGARQRGACPALPREVVESSREVWSRADLQGEEAQSQTGFTHELRPTFVVLEGSGWQLDTIRSAAGKAARILGQCGITIPEVTVRVVEGPEWAKIYRDDWSSRLVADLAPHKPAVFFVKDTLQEIPFEAEAIGRSNSRKRRQLADTVWMTAGGQDLGISLAHEIYHAVADIGEHDPDATNLMHERTNGSNTTLRASQCLRLIRVGEALGNLKRIN